MTMPLPDTLADTQPDSLPPLPASAPLALKTERARAVLHAALKEARDPARLAVAFTGGKDSTVVLALWRELLREAQPTAPLKALSLDTGLKFPEVTAFRDALAADWGVELLLARPEIELAAYPVAQDKIACCRDLKVLPLKKALRQTGLSGLLSGLRRDEHPSRQGRPYREERSDPEYVQFNPILDWTEMDVWAYITGNALPYCALYHEGYRSLGCRPCTRPAGVGEDERAGRDPDKERHLETLKSLGYF